LIDLLLSILASTFIFLIFKLFDRFKINTLQAIVINYISACALGLLSYEAPIILTEITASKWFFGAFVLGFLFIFIFNVMALTAQRNGLSVASVATKMSVIIPVVFGIYMYQESTSLQKILGIILALVAVYLASVKSKSLVNTNKGLLFPMLLFIGSGIIDTSIKYIETRYLPDNGIPIFSATIFGFAACIGISLLVYNAFKKQFKFEFKSVIGGVILGIVNYYSIYYLLKALNHDSLESSTLFTLNNVGIVMLSTLLGLFLFKEHFSKKNWMGIVLAIVSIYLVTFA
jgi:drug/metabolite transporter (DMT)-like permease